MRVYKNVLFNFIIKFIVVFIDNKLIRTWNMEHVEWEQFLQIAVWTLTMETFLSIFILTLLTLLCLTAQSLLLPVVSISLNKIEAFPTFSASWTIWWVREEILSITDTTSTVPSPTNHLVWNHNSIRQTQISFCSRDLQEVLCCSLDYRRWGNVAVGGSSSDDVGNTVIKAYGCSRCTNYCTIVPYCTQVPPLS